MVNAFGTDSAKWWRNRRIQAYLGILLIFAISGSQFWLPSTMIPLSKTLAWIGASFVFLYQGAASGIDAIDAIKKKLE